MTGAGAFQAAAAFFANLILVRFLSPEDFGEFALILVNVNLVLAIVEFRTSQLVLRLPAEELDERRIAGYTGAMVVQTFIVAAGALMLLTAFGHLGVRAMILLATTLAGPWLAFEHQLYERSFEYGRLSVLETTGLLASHLFTVAGVLMGWGAIVLYLRPAVELGLYTAGLAVVGGLRRLPVRWFTVREWKEFLREIRGFWADGVLEQLYERVVILAVGSIAGTRALGFFYQARRIAITPHQLLQPLTHRMAFNYFSHRVSPERRHGILMQGMILTGAGLLALALAAYFVADPVIPWLFGPTWEPVVPLLLAQLGVVVGMTLYYLVKAYCMALGRMDFFVLYGRILQYAVFGAAVVWAWAQPAIGSRVLSVGYSTSFILPTIAVVVMLGRLRDEHPGTSAGPVR